METIETAGYVMVLLPLRERTGTGGSQIYRGRWQIELVFKRLKSLLDSDISRKRMPPALKPGCMANVCSIPGRNVASKAKRFPLGVHYPEA
jgi:hypothetical protein